MKEIIDLEGKEYLAKTYKLAKAFGKSDSHL